MNRKSPVLVTTLVLALLAAACGDDDDASPDPTTSTTAAPEETTTSVDPFTVPDEITVEYVEAVLTELEKINGDALRLAVAEGMSPRVTDLLATIYEGRALTDRANGISLVLDELVETPGDIRVSVESVTPASDDCVLVDVTEDYSDVSPDGQADVAARIVLIRTASVPARNPTGWVVRTRQVAIDESELTTCE